MNSKNSNIDELDLIGFTKIGCWIIDGNQDNKLKADWDNLSDADINIENALYAFVEVKKGNLEREIKYIGKTSKSIKNRFMGYRSPGNTTATNANCNSKIQYSLKAKNTIEIWAFTPIIPLQILGYNLNLAAGLEDDLILKLNPEWNGGKTASACAEIVCEKEEIEPEQSNSTIMHASNSNQQKSLNSDASFVIKLGSTYFNTGFINPGSVASEKLGQHGEQVTIYLGSTDLCVNSTINQTANPNGSVRIIGNNSKIAEWFQTHFSQGEVVNAFVIDANTIFLEDPKPPV